MVCSLTLGASGGGLLGSSKKAAPPSHARSNSGNQSLEITWHRPARSNSGTPPKLSRSHTREFGTRFRRNLRNTIEPTLMTNQPEMADTPLLKTLPCFGGVVVRNTGKLGPLESLNPNALLHPLVCSKGPLAMRMKTPDVGTCVQGARVCCKGTPTHNNRERITPEV